MLWPPTVQLLMAVLPFNSVVKVPGSGPVSKLPFVKRAGQAGVTARSVAIMAVTRKSFLFIRKVLLLLELLNSE